MKPIAKQRKLLTEKKWTLAQLWTFTKVIFMFKKVEQSGVVPPINHIKLPDFLTRARIRSKAFFLWTDRMLEFKKDEICKKDLNALMTYINDKKKKETQLN